MLEELREFHRFLSEKVRANAVDLSPEEALDQWRRQHPPADAPDEDVEAVREALDDLAKGDRGAPFDQFDREFRQRHNLPT
ncbi:MAG TPA: hypothetical protein VKD90_27415 [Gemmataceae bacterium]|nr:hypothetical protein [Gemmataceae bacterium]